ncbi:3-dehydroquinate synthase [Staphylococcus chromogenes]|uniref:3-dehydroquinate synthase n=1 Tax=Staphylococcus chromogenes TaxID=46126 RepID=UPI000D1BD498|nr:3-dehydroquinate synthase [Staphylococcus chromogenes]PTG00881.1 3-dehydroquinate synthase [Staphylococcus chromogenes]
MQLHTRYPHDNYPIIVENGAIHHLNDFLSDYEHIFILIDEHVAKCWPDVQHQIKPKHTLITIPSGEQVKYIQYYEQYMGQILSFKPTRQTCLVAIGGGATGDFVGFLAATLLRGVDFIQVPTTLLAHDSSIGGKVGINSPQGKNLIGAFYRPKAVIYDLDFLTTLPQTEILSGYAEVYKHAVLNSKKAVNQLEQMYPNVQTLLKLKNIETVIVDGIETKLNIVLADEKEQGQRKFLNLGHTFGHAIEYQHHLAHGHSVMLGILFQYFVSNLILKTQYSTTSFYQYLKELHYPLSIIDDFNFEQLYEYMLSDKKNDATGVQMVLLKDFGQPTVQHIPKSILKQSFNQMVALHQEVI